MQGELCCKMGEVLIDKKKSQQLITQLLAFNIPDKGMVKLEQTNFFYPQVISYDSTTYPFAVALTTKITLLSCSPFITPVMVTSLSIIS